MIPPSHPPPTPHADLTNRRVLRPAHYPAVLISGDALAALQHVPCAILTSEGADRLWSGELASNDGSGSSSNSSGSGGSAWNTATRQRSAMDEESPSEAARSPPTTAASTQVHLASGPRSAPVPAAPSTDGGTGDGKGQALSRMMASSYPPPAPSPYPQTGRLLAVSPAMLRLSGLSRARLATFHLTRFAKESDVDPGGMGCVLASRARW